MLLPVPRNDLEAYTSLMLCFGQGLDKCTRYVCLEPNPLFAVNSIPHVTGPVPCIDGVSLLIQGFCVSQRILTDLSPKMTAVIHRGGMVVRNGTAPDLDTLLEAMAAEPVD